MGEREGERDGDRRKGEGDENKEEEIEGVREGN